MCRHRALAVSFVALVLALLAPASAASAVPRGAEEAAPSRPVVLQLPAPDGPFPVGTTTVHMVDRDRRDPWVPFAGSRELMVSIWYPALPGPGPAAPWMAPLAGKHYVEGLVSGTDVAPGSIVLPTTHSRIDAPLRPGPGGRPVVLYSPGYAEDRTISTALVEDLASHGFVVVTIDHTFDAAEIEFPGGRLVLRQQPEPTEDVLVRSTQIRAADARFVLDQLAHRFHGMLDLDGVGMLGHSLGGASTAVAMREDPRIVAGANLDGTLRGPVVDLGVDRPFLQMGRQGHSSASDPLWARFAARSSDVREVAIPDSQHYSFTDLQATLPALAAALGDTRDEVTPLIGTVEPAASFAQQRTHLLDFFTTTLRPR